LSELIRKSFCIFRIAIRHLHELDEIKVKKNLSYEPCELNKALTFFIRSQHEDCVGGLIVLPLEEEFFFVRPGVPFYEVLKMR
jgi:hypothetical protein